jgi:hypothetical protein
VGALTSEDDWQELVRQIQPVDDVNVLKNLIGTFRSLGAGGYVFEHGYIDRDFSAAYSAFYSSLFHPYLKYCRRLHFFGENLSDLGEVDTAEGLARALEEKDKAYIGFIVLRPVRHAPVGLAVASCLKLAEDPAAQIEVRARYAVHLLGADLTVEGFPLTQQDTRVGACAQAAIWMAGRHFHRRHGGPWFSMPDVTEAALKPTDNVISRSLPAGSEFLTPDNMVRALRAMERHPVVHAAKLDEAKPVWVRPAHDIVSRYLDSGIPVILGLKPRGAGTVGHAVVAVGRVVREHLPEDLPPGATWAEMTSHFLVADDQRGLYRRLPVSAADRSDEYPWTLEDDGAYAMVPLPAKVYMTAEVAEDLARDTMESLVRRADEFRERAREATAEGEVLGAAKDADPSFFGGTPELLVARTYLTYGWKYKRRALRNRLPAVFKAELMKSQFPRYVWVTEFSLPGDLDGFNVCDRKVRAHVVIDATGSLFWSSALVVQIPGVALFFTFDPTNPAAKRSLTIRATNESEPFFPKVRGWDDFDRCPI